MPLAVVTGGRGGLGSELVPRLQQAGYTVRITSRGSRPDGLDEATEFASMNLEAAEGIDAAIAGADVVVHCASSPFRKTKQVDILGTRALVERARAASTPHFFYISIVGIDRIPFSYYKAKLAAENIIEGAAIPYSILRATQFHSLIDRFFSTAVRGPVAFFPTDFKFQPIDTGEVADRMAADIKNGPGGRLPDIGGPAVRTARDLLDSWLTARGKKTRVMRAPLMGKGAAGFRAGYNCCPDNADGTITWEEHLAKVYARALV